MSDTKENTEELFPLAEYEQEKKEIMQFRSCSFFAIEGC